MTDEETGGVVKVIELVGMGRPDASLGAEATGEAA